MPFGSLWLFWSIDFVLLGWCVNPEWAGVCSIPLAKSSVCEHSFVTGDRRRSFTCGLMKVPPEQNLPALLKKLK